MMTGHLRIAVALATGLIVLGTGCDRGSEQTHAGANRVVIVYTALDREFSAPILESFTEKTGIAMRAAYDTEATKTVGLVNRIRAEAGNPRCDVFWNNEILNTLRLKNEGLLQPCKPEAAANYPEQFRDAEGFWYGFAARARVLIVNTELVTRSDMPTSVSDLAAPDWRGKTGIAKPLFGTTASHVACLFAALGPDAARSLLTSFKDNEIEILAGNKTCAEKVAAGQLAYALTDTDDAIIEVEAGRPVEIIFPDGGDGQMGTLALPNTLSVVKGAPHPREALALIEYLLSAEVEARLAEGPSAQIPLNRKTTARSRVADLSKMKLMDVDFAAAAERFPEAAAFIEEHFLY